MSGIYIRTLEHGLKNAFRRHHSLLIYQREMERGRDDLEYAVSKFYKPYRNWLILNSLRKRPKICVAYQNLTDCRVPVEDASVMRSISLCIFTASAKVGAS